MKARWSKYDVQLLSAFGMWIWTYDGSGLRWQVYNLKFDHREQISSFLFLQCTIENWCQRSFNTSWYLQRWFVASFSYGKAMWWLSVQGILRLVKLFLLKSLLPINMNYMTVESIYWKLWYGEERASYTMSTRENAGCYGWKQESCRNFKAGSENHFEKSHPKPKCFAKLPRNALDDVNHSKPTDRLVKEPLLKWLKCREGGSGGSWMVYRGKRGRNTVILRKIMDMLTTQLR